MTVSDKVNEMMNSGAMFYLNIVIGLLLLISAVAGIYLQWLNWSNLTIMDKLKGLMLNLALAVGGIMSALIGYGIVMSKKAHPAIEFSTIDEAHIKDIEKQFKGKETKK